MKQIDHALVNDMKQILRLLFHALVIAVCLFSQSFAEIYSECVYSWEFGNEDRKLLVVRPVGNICYKRCDHECSSFIRGYADMSTDPDTYKESEYGMNNDLNKEVVEQCMLKCQMGELFTGTYNEYDEDGGKIVTKGPITTKVACSKSGIASADYNYYQSELVVDPTKRQEMRVFMIDQSGLSDEGNSVYLCGFKTVVLKPVWSSLLKSEWPSSAVLSSRMTNRPEDWFAKNYQWTDTGIDLKNGDYLEIIYGGNYIFWPDVRNYNNPINRNLQIWTPKNFGSSFNNYADLDMLPASQFKLQDITITYDDDGNPIGCDYGDIESVTQYNNALNKDFGAWHNLKGRVWSQTRALPSAYNQTKFIQEFGASLGQLLWEKIIDPNDNTKEKYDSISFAGTLVGFTNEYTRLAFRHVDNVGSASAINSNYADNIGGMDISVKWRGCGFRSGERLQYAIIPVNESSEYVPDAPSVVWRDVRMNQYFQTEGDAKGVVFFRIKMLDKSYSAQYTPTCNTSTYPCSSTLQAINAQSKYANYNTTGEYYIGVEKKAEDAPVSSGLNTILTDITDYFFKDDPDNPRNGVVPKIFKHIVSDSGFASTIRAVLVLYVAFTGLSFIIGLAQINQKEAVTRILKIAIVLALISDNSWDLFNSYLFNFFSMGSLELIGHIVGSMSDSAQFDTHDVIDKPATVFAAFDTPFRQLFSSQVWAKIAALLCAGLLGIVVSIAVIFGIVMYAFCIARVLMLYLVSVVILGILFLISPVFICCILFQYTKSFFDAWFKQMLSFALQPVFVVASVAFLNNLLLTALYITLSFTACKVCLFGFSLFSIDVCFVEGYMSLMGLHSPPSNSFGIPMGTVAAAICFLLIGQAMYVFCSFASSLANIIATSSMVGINLSGIASPVTAVGHVFNAANYVKSVVVNNAANFMSRNNGRDIQRKAIKQSAGTSKPRNVQNAPTATANTTTATANTTTATANTTTATTNTTTSTSSNDGR